MRIEQEAEKMLAFLTGEIDHHSAKTIREEIDGKAEQYLPSELILDFKGVTFMDSSGIGLVMGRYKKMAELNGTVRIVNLPSPIRRVMILAGLDKLVVIE